MRQTALRTGETNFRLADPSEDGAKTGTLETLNRALVNALKRMGDPCRNWQEGAVIRFGRWRGHKRKTGEDQKARKKKNYIARLRRMTEEERRVFLDKRAEAQRRYSNNKKQMPA